MNVRELMARLQKMDPELPVVMAATPEYLGDCEVTEVAMESYARERTGLQLSYPLPVKWRDAAWASLATYQCDPPQPVALLQYEPPNRPVIDVEIDHPAIESGDSA